MLLREDPYVLKFSTNPQTITVDGYEKPIKLPLMPPENQIRGYRLPANQQRFTRDPFPKDFKFWEPKKQNVYVNQMFHLRDNGEWIFIKGHPYYIPGGAWTFFNYWNTELGGLPQFRMEALEFQWIWELDIERDPFCFGLVDLKPRRIGDTEKGGFNVWNRTTRYADAHGALLANDEIKVRENFARIVNANYRMIAPFKPINRGKTKPAKELIYDFPTEGTYAALTAKDSTKAQDYIEPLMSRIDYAASTPTAFDGQRCFTILYDEIFKIKRFDPNEHVKLLKPTMTLHGGASIIGKLLAPSTIEELDDDEMISNCKRLYEDSDPNVRDPMGRTISGLYRVFRSGLLTDDVDSYGFHNRERKLREIERQREFLEKSGKLQELSKYRKQVPLEIEDCFSIPISSGAIYPHLINSRINQLKDKKDWKGNHEEPKGEFGNIVWIDEFGGRTRWIPDEKGKWFITIHPTKPNDVFLSDGLMKPASKLWSAGSDPIDDVNVDSKTHDSNLSKAGIVVLRRDEEENLKYGSNGELLNPEEKKTGRIACSYLYRGDSPFECYEDNLKTAIYYGTEISIETNRTYVKNRMEDDGYRNFISLRKKSGGTKVAKKSRERGQKSNTEVIGLYKDLITEYVERYWMIIDHPWVLEAIRKFDGTNQGKLDAFVAFGYALMKEKAASVVVQSSGGWSTDIF